MPRLAIVAGSLAAALATLPQAARSQQPPACSDSIYSAFDFWIGSWEVRLADGSLAGYNTVQRFAGSCGLMENWRGTGGSVGRSENYVDPVDGHWHQLWVDGSGLVLRLEGGAYQGGMRLEGTGRDTTRLHRLTWSPLDDGRVRQHWEISADGGATWSTVFDGYYTRLPTPESAGTGSEQCDTPQGHAFDFWPGEWRVESRLRDAGGEWHETHGIWRAERVLGGCGFLDFTTGDYGDGLMSGVGSRFYDSAADQWIVTWVSTQNPGKMGVWVGTFDGDRTGEFLRETETPNGTVRSRIRWSNVTDDAADWDYAISRGDAADWQIMWTMKLTKLGSGGSP